VAAGAGGANTLTLSSASAAPSASSPAGASLGNSLFSGLDLSASLQALTSVNLLTTDTRIGSRYQGDLTILTAGSTPTYCGGFSADSELQTMSSLQLSSSPTPFVAAPPISVLSTTASQPTSAYCPMATVVTAAPGTPVIFSPLAIPIGVTNPSASTPVPTGTVQVNLDSATCMAALDGTGRGSCDLTPPTAGSRMLAYRYLGDGNYPAGAVVSQPLVVNHAQPIVALTYTPNPVSGASTVIFSFTVHPNPDNGVQARPSGSVTISGLDVTTPCTGTLDASGAGSCTYQFPPNLITPTNQLFFTAGALVANYSGDANYAAKSSPTLNFAAIGLEVTGLIQLTVGATASYAVTAFDAFSSGPVTTPPNLVWTSSAPGVATVSGGTVTAVSAGTVTITATDPVSLASGSTTITVTQ
jgi:hypothetical protein